MKKVYLGLLLFLFFLPGEVFAACISSISFNANVADSWESNCPSENRAGSYAKYYTFTLLDSREVTIDLQSETDTFLFLLSGSGQTGNVIASNDDSNRTTNSQIVETLSAGTYTVEATTFEAAVTGDFEVSVSGQTPPSGVCNHTIITNTDISDSWESSCASVNRPGSYAKYYTFTLSGSEDVIIGLTSSQNTYLFLLEGASETGTVITSDDDSNGSTNSQIARTLSAGTYTVEATTYDPETLGEFVVSVSDVTKHPPECIESMNINSSESGSWDVTCISENRPGSYARYYTFSLSARAEVTIDLDSTEDTYLFLVSGSDPTGSVITSNDDKAGNSSDSQIIRVLSAGTYTIEATTYVPATKGDFDLSLSASAPICTDCPFLINAGLNDAWFNIVTSGQGLTITIFPGRKEVFVAWFTYDTERPPEDVTAMLGEPGHRWLTAQGPYDGDTAVLTIYVTEGGVFDSPVPVTSTDLDGDGTMTLEFAGCNEGMVTYEITSLGISGEFPIERIVTDNLPLCELLLSEMQ